MSITGLLSTVMRMVLPGRKCRAPMEVAPTSWRPSHKLPSPGFGFGLWNPCVIGHPHGRSLRYFEWGECVISGCRVQLCHDMSRYVEYMYAAARQNLVPLVSPKMMTLSFAGNYPAQVKRCNQMTMETWMTIQYPNILEPLLEPENVSMSHLVFGGPSIGHGLPETGTTWRWPNQSARAANYQAFHYEF